MTKQPFERIADIARRLGKNPHGFRTNDPAFGGRSPSMVGNSLQHMVASGKLIKVRIGPKNVLFFSAKTDAEASVVHFNERRIAKRSTVSVVVPRARVHGDADYAHAKVTVCPGFAPRNVALDVLAPLLRQTPYRRSA